LSRIPVQAKIRRRQEVTNNQTIDLETGEILGDSGEEVGTEETVDMSGVEGLQSGEGWTAMLKRMEQPPADRHIGLKEIQGSYMVYLSWSVITAYLDRLCPRWTWVLEPYQVVHLDIPSGGFVVAQGKLTLTVGNVTETRSGEGDAVLITKNMREGKKDYGTPFDLARSQAIRQAAAKFGFGRMYYNKSVAEETVRRLLAARNIRAAGPAPKPYQPRQASTPPRSQAVRHEAPHPKPYQPRPPYGHGSVDGES
jgi:hypothetical protein